MSSDSFSDPAEASPPPPRATSKKSLMCLLGPRGPHRTFGKESCLATEKFIALKETKRHPTPLSVGDRICHKHRLDVVNMKPVVPPYQRIIQLPGLSEPVHILLTPIDYSVSDLC